MSLASVTSTTFRADVLESPFPVVVDFTAAWCPPCRVMPPVLAQLAAERGDLRVVSVDVDAEPELAARHQVLSMPTFVVFRHGAEIARLVGARPKRRLVAELDELLEQQPAGR